MPNIADITPFENPLGEKVYELERTEHMSLAYAVVTGKSASHKHPFEEIYFVTKGRGTLYIGQELIKIIPGDSYTIPKDTFHHLEATVGTLELVVVCSPPYDQTQVTYE